MVAAHLPPRRLRRGSGRGSARHLRSASIPVRDVLELGSGGGNNAMHLKASFALTLVDLSEAMLAVSRRLNPECSHHRGDMRTVRLGRQFDAVFVHDAVDYMVTEADLRAVMDTAFVHCRPGGLALFVPDDTRESFVPGTDHGGHDGPDRRAARYLEWTWDPDPADTTVTTEYAFLLRDADGSVTCVPRDAPHRPVRSGRLAGPARRRRLRAARRTRGDHRGPTAPRAVHRPPAARLTDVRTVRSSGRRRGCGRPRTGPTSRGSTGGSRPARRAPVARRATPARRRPRGRSAAASRRWRR